MSELALPANLGIEHVGDLQQALQPHFEAEGPVTLVADAVERVHAASLQLLHAFVRDRAGAGRATVLARPSPALANAARQLALAGSLGIENQNVSGDNA